MKCFIRYVSLAGVVILMNLNALTAQKIDLGYTGNNLWNPGITAGYHKPFASGVLSWALKGQTYWDPGSHGAVSGMIGLRWNKKRNDISGWNVGLFPLGVYRSFLPETWEVDGVGNLTRIRGAGNVYLNPSVDLRFERSVYEKNSSWYLGISGSLLLGYNTYLLPLFFVEASLTLPTQSQP